MTETGDWSTKPRPVTDCAFITVADGRKADDERNAAGTLSLLTEGRRNAYGRFDAAVITPNKIPVLLYSRLAAAPSLAIERTGWRHPDDRHVPHCYAYVGPAGAWVGESVRPFPERELESLEPERRGIFSGTIHLFATCPGVTDNRAVEAILLPRFAKRFGTRLPGQDILLNANGSPSGVDPRNHSERCLANTMEAMLLLEPIIKRMLA
jgi:hypothetical protein